MKEHLWSRLAVGLVLAGATLVAPAIASFAVESPAAPRFHARLAGAPVVVVGRVSRVQPFDHDRVRVIHLAVDRVLKGEERLGSTGAQIEIVEMRDRPSAPPLLDGGDRAIVFLRRMSRGSYLDETLGVGRRWQASDGAQGIVADRDQTVVDEAAGMVDRLVEQSRTPAVTQGERAAARRTWVFDAIGGRHAALVEEGAAGLAEIPGLADGLAPEEQLRIEKAVVRDDLPPRVQAALVAAIGDERLRALAPTLATLNSDEAEVLAASWTALAELGTPPRSGDIAKRLHHEAPEVRSAAARAYVAQYPQEAVPALGRFFANEDEKDVRIEVLEALGPVGDEDATKLIESAFVEDGELAVRQAAGRVLFERGGEAAAESLGRLAFAAAPEGQRHATALFMALGRPSDDPTLKRIRDSHPDAKVREMVEHGFKDPHQHGFKDPDH